MTIYLLDAEGALLREIPDAIEYTSQKAVYWASGIRVQEYCEPGQYFAATVGAEMDVMAELRAESEKTRLCLQELGSTIYGTEG